MNTFRRKLAGLALAMGLGFGLVSNASASTVALTTDGAWHTFDVDSFTSLTGGLEWIDYADNSALSFIVNNAAPVLLTVVDGGFAGDVFSVYDNGTLLGATSAATNNYPDSIGLDFGAALLNPLYSKGTYLLAAGSHTITGLLATSAVGDFGALDATAGAVTLQAVPEPAEWATLIAGLFMLSFAHRARQSRK